MSRRTSGRTEAGRPTVRLRRVLSVLEGASLRAEGLVRRAVRSNRLSPFPYAGTISVFLLAVVVITGIYLTFFFEFGFAASYRSVVKLEANPIQRVVRGIHRYSSAALVVTTLVHGWRIFVMARFSGPRRWRWVTGVVALLVVWLAGMTGYWLIWDQRAQAITEATASLLQAFGAGTRYVVDVLAGRATDTGWAILFAIWVAHLLLTAVVGWFLWRHLRRTHLRWLPPRPWMWVMGGALLVVSIVVPLGMLGPADPARLVSGMRLDPFVLFLLPPLLSAPPWAVLGLSALLLLGVSLLPWALGARRTPVVRIIDEACTGCELCVVDCPYEALVMEDREQANNALAVLLEDRCVGCGICLGSCSFGAIELPGASTAVPPDVAGRRIVLACERHVRLGGVIPDAEIVPVTCTGMIHPQAVGTLVEAGASSVQLVGCPPGDCVYGMGNELAAERLEGRRRPRLPRRWEGAAFEDWVAPTTLRRAVDDPGAHPVAGGSTLPSSRRRLATAGAVVLLSVLLVAFATEAPFRPSTGDAELAVLVHHVPGEEVLGLGEPVGTPGVDAELVVRVDGATAADRVLTGAVHAAFLRIPVDARPSTVSVTFEGPTGSAVVFDGTVDPASGDRVFVEVRDVPPGPGVEEGRRIFEQGVRGAATGCRICHSLEPDRVLVGPSLAGVGSRAGSRVPGMTAEEYLRQSILEPDAYVVDGFPAGQMLDIYGDILTDEQVDALVAFLMSLTDGGS